MSGRDAIKRCLRPALLLATSLWASGAAAQNFQPFLESEIPFDISRGRNVSVQERPRPEYAPLGLKTGGFTIFPSVLAGAGYTSNVFGSATDASKDVFGLIDPAVSVRSNWSRNALNLTASGSLRRFAEETLKNETGLFLGGDGRFDIGSDANLFAAANIRRGYETQYSGSFPANAGSSVRYVRQSATLRATYGGSRVRLIASGDVNDVDFGDTRSRTGALLDQDFRDRTIYRGSGRIEYGLTPDIAAFGQITYSNTGYRETLGTQGNRDSDEMRLLGGVTFDLTALVRASIGAGYVNRKYDAAQFASIAGFAADARLEYFPSQLTTVTLTARRSVEDAIVTGSSGFFLTAIDLRVDHELLRNLILNAEAGYERDKFETVSRRDRLYRVSGGARYMVSPNVYLNGDVFYIDRNSKGFPIGQAFDELRGLISISYQI